MFFKANAKLLKNPECKKYIQYGEKFQGKLCFQDRHVTLLCFRVCSVFD